MRWLLSEYILKGIYLGLLLHVAFLADWQKTATVALFTLGGLVLCLGVAGWQKRRQGYAVHGKWAAFILFLLLESPALVYAGIVLGLAAGAYEVRKPGTDDYLLLFVAGGGGLGIAFWLLRQVEQRWFRLGLCLALGAALVAAALYGLDRLPDHLQDPKARTVFGGTLLLGIPIFYLLTFAGLAEESEVEIGAICAALGLGMWMLLSDSVQLRMTAFTLPVILYFFYSTRVLHHLRVFKHTVRGIGYAKVGRYRPALLAFRRALQLDPQNNLAHASLWTMHRAMDMTKVAQDHETMALVDFDLCLERAKSLLLEPGPSPKQLAEAHHFLDLVASHKPAVLPVIHYWRAVAYTHQRLYDQGAVELERVLDSSSWPARDPQRESVLLAAWQLALILHPELQRRLGARQLAIPGRRMEAIAAVERQLVAKADDTAAWDLKRLLYSGLSEADYKAAVGDSATAADFDHSYAHQLGLALINDPARWQRGAEYLRLAARGLPAQAPSIYQQLAQACRRAGDTEGMWHSYALAKRAGLAFGHKNLAPDERQIYFAIVKLLADEARARNDLDAAIENYHLYTEFERSGLETLRILADLYERKGDVAHALRVTDIALLYNAKDADLLERKDRYYYSVLPGQVQAGSEAFRNSFDVDYCLRKARSLLEYREVDADLIDWAQHLAELAQVVRPESVAAKVLRSRAARCRGEIDQAQALLEDAYANRPEKFATSDDEDAWFLSCRLLGELYLNDLGKPDLAIPCFKDFRKSSKSGADTMYKIALAYEQLGDRVRAKKYYEHVTAYNNHPLAPDAREALYRLESQ